MALARGRIRLPGACRQRATAVSPPPEVQPGAPSATRREQRAHLRRGGVGGSGSPLPGPPDLSSHVNAARATVLLYLERSLVLGSGIPFLSTFQYISQIAF